MAAIAAAAGLSCAKDAPAYYSGMRMLSGSLETGGIIEHVNAYGNRTHLYVEYTRELYPGNTIALAKVRYERDEQADSAECTAERIYDWEHSTGQFGGDATESWLIDEACNGTLDTIVIEQSGPNYLYEILERGADFGNEFDAAYNDSRNYVEDRLSLEDERAKWHDWKGLE